MIDNRLIWATVVFALAQSEASPLQACSAGRLEELRREYRLEGDRLRAHELCGHGWVELGEDLSLEAEALEASGQRETASASPRLEELSGQLRERIADCEESLRDRHQVALQRLKDHQKLLKAAATTTGSDGLTHLIEWSEKLYQSVDGYATSGRQVLELEREVQDIENHWAGLDPCEPIFRPAMARLGSVSITQSFDELCRVTEMQCLYPPHATMARDALERLVPATDGFPGEVKAQDAAKMTREAHTLLRIPAGRLQSCLPGAKRKLQTILDTYEPESPASQSPETASLETLADPRGDAKPLANPESAAEPLTDPVEETETTIAIGNSEETIQRPEPEKPSDHKLAVTEPEALPAIGFALNVWQSAWDDFSSFEDIVPYLRHNQILEVNLNPGIGMTAKSFSDAYRRLKPLVEILRRGGVETINFLYAELNYPIERYADFLNAYPDLNIDRIVDDSEFTDYFMNRFQQNRERVESRDVHYSAFITLEGYGNSGVSDKSRYWALRHLDQPILMSYFSCTVDEQIALLREYLELADGLDREHRYVKVALLLGGKSTGREVSCELELDAAAFQDFVAELDQRLRLFPSYAGIVLETNYRLPRYDLTRSARRGAR